MASEFITRVERDKDEPYTVIFHTDDADKYKHIEDECRKMIGHAKPTEQPTVDAVQVVRCKECIHRPKMPDNYMDGFDLEFHDHKCPCQCEDGFYSWYPADDWFCADGERRTE